MKNYLKRIVNSFQGNLTQNPPISSGRQVSTHFPDDRYNAPIERTIERQPFSQHSQIEFEADTIDEILSSFGFEEVFVVKCTSTRTANVFDLRLPPSTKISSIMKLEDEIAYGLGKNSVRITRNGNRLSIEVPKTVKVGQNLIDILTTMSPPPPFCAVLGADMSGQPLAIRLTSPEVAHVLIVGQTGSGKTALTRSILCSLAYFNTPRKMQFVLIDPKSTGFGPLARLPNTVGGIIKTPEDAVAKLEELVSEMERRDHDKTRDWPQLIVAIDELADLIMASGDRIKQPITRLCQRGREGGIHVIACTQKPVASVLGGVMTANFPIKLCGAVASKGEARIATGIAGSGAEKLEGRGDFLMIKSGSPERFRSTWLDAEGFEKILRKVLNKKNERFN